VGGQRGGTRRSPGSGRTCRTARSSLRDPDARAHCAYRISIVSFIDSIDYR
jgi:hypothetical protein